MRVVHLSTTDYGGAYIAAERISRALSMNGVISNVLVRTKTRKSSRCQSLFYNQWEIFQSKCKNVGNLILSDDEIVTDYWGTDVSSYQEVMEADVVFLHWVNSFVSYQGVKRLIKSGKPVIWVMHDMWLFTGGCHCDWYCGRYDIGCRECPLIHSKRKSGLPKKNIYEKRKMLETDKILFVGPSKWLTECAGRSLILKEQDIRWIPNPIDTTVFRPIEDKKGIRRKYRIEENKFVILFGAAKLDDQNKGMHYLLEALRKLNLAKEKYEIVVFGSGMQKKFGEITVKSLGVVNKEEEMAEIYNLADVFVAPSQQESFGYTVCEALSCGIPVTAFAVGGYLDQIIMGENGYLAPLGDTQALAYGIKYCIENYICLTEKARKRIVENNNDIIIGSKYRKLCEEVLKIRTVGINQEK